MVAGFILDGERLLVARRRAADARGGLWEFPGGKLEPGETPEEALARELREELGIEVEVGEKLAAVDHDYPDVRIKLSLYLCRITAGRPRPLSCAEVRWIDAGELASLPLAPADRSLAEHLVRSGKLPPGG